MEGIYSQTGFDLIGVLSRVVNRKNPIVAVGNVDLSCAFTVSDPSKPDCPILYASDTFSKLTGYANSEIIGRNCRFLQSPTGVVAKGSVRKFSDGYVAFQMKQAVEECRECQFSIINYRKSGEPFINLVTIIPIFNDHTRRVEYFVGFQVDLVEQPQAILSRCKEGSYLVDYKIADKLLQRNTSEDMKEAVLAEVRSSPFTGSEHSSAKSQSSEPVPLYSYFMETSDFVHILSLKARFLYASPVALKNLLEYPSANELIGKELQEFVHPADLVSVMRELRTSHAGDSINFICRFRRKFSGYVYMEVSGHIFESSNMNRKCFILSGRELHVCMLPVVPGDPQDSDVWAKLSPEGVILHVISSSRQLLGIDHSELVGTRILDFVYMEDKPNVKESLANLTKSRLYDQFSCRIGRLDAGRVHTFVPTIMQLYSEPHSKSHVFCRIRVISQNPTNAPLVDYAVNLFDIMTETRATSLHYELNHLRMQNKRLKEELDSINTVSVRRK